MKLGNTPLRNDDHKLRWLRVIIGIGGISTGISVGATITQSNIQSDIVKLILMLLCIALGIAVCVKRRSIAEFLYDLFKG